MHREKHHSGRIIKSFNRAHPLDTCEEAGRRHPPDVPSDCHWLAMGSGLRPRVNLISHDPNRRRAQPSHRQRAAVQSGTIPRFTLEGLRSTVDLAALGFAIGVLGLDCRCLALLPAIPFGPAIVGPISPFRVAVATTTSSAFG